MGEERRGAIKVIERDQPSWRRHEFYMRLAVVVESGAKCLGSRVGAAVVRDDRVLGTGYNGTPSGFPNCTVAERGCRRCALRFEETDAHLSGRLYDICLCVHAEQNALATGARFGVAVEGGTLYTTLQPCFNCLKEIMQVGIRAVIFRRPWEVRHPDYGWVEGEYERLVEHFRGRGNLFARLAQEEPLPPVEVELGRPA
ncbi:MAG: deoxycytidylate deaminase [Candidatus Limnocylindrales bacterium]